MLSAKKAKKSLLRNRSKLGFITYNYFDRESALAFTRMR